MKTNKNTRVGILIVNGKENPKEGKWLALCLDKIKKHTHWSHYRIYVWNNDPHDRQIEKLVRKMPRAKLLCANPEEKLTHPHAVPLQRLYEIARKDEVKYLVTLDTDAFPIKDNWLQYLVGQLDEETVLAGVWRDELKKTIKPYIHPSCLCTSVEFIEKNGLRFDTVDIKGEKKIDTLSLFSHRAEELDKKTFKLKRSNKNQLHYIMGGIYGDLVYHQSAANRQTTFFWGEEHTPSLEIKNLAIKQALQHLAFQHNRELIDWLMGKAQKPGSIFIIGPNSASVNCVMKGLDFDQEVAVINLQDLLPQGDSLIGKGIYWIQDADALAGLKKRSGPARGYVLIGIYTQPSSGAREGMTAAWQRWHAYQSVLRKWHGKFHFPLIKFTPDSPEDFIDQAAQLTIELGFDPDIKRISKEIQDITREIRAKNENTKPGGTKIPRRYLKIQVYLEKHRFQPGVDTFSGKLLKLKKELLKLENEGEDLVHG